MSFIRHPNYPDHVLVPTNAAADHFREEYNDVMPVSHGSWPCCKCPIINDGDYRRYCDSSCRMAYGADVSVVWVPEVEAIAMALKGIKVQL